MTAAPALLRPLRFKLTLWYSAILGTMLVLLFGGLFLAIGHRYQVELHDSLIASAAQLEVAARTRDMEAGMHGPVVDAVRSLRIAGRALYLLRADGSPVIPADAPTWVREGGSRAGRSGQATIRRKVGDTTLELFAERFRLRRGRVLVAAVVADHVELDDRYSALINAFAAAAAVALLLAAGGGWVLVRQATAPIESNIARMRRFMADAAHELRTPIAVLRTRAEVTLQRDRSVAEYAAALQTVASESRRLGRIVDDLLTLARADSGERVPACTNVPLDELTMDAVGAAGPLATARGVALSLERCDEAPVTGDEALLRQLIMILLDNAIKFTPTGGRVEVSVRTGGGHATLTVRDNGIGIGPQELPHVFDRFFRGDMSRHRDAAADSVMGGAGLGLSIAQWIAGLHGSILTLESTAKSEAGDADGPRHRGTSASVRIALRANEPSRPHSTAAGSDRQEGGP